MCARARALVCVFVCVCVLDLVTKLLQFEQACSLCWKNTGICALSPALEQCSARRFCGELQDLFERRGVACVACRNGMPSVRANCLPLINNTASLHLTTSSRTLASVFLLPFVLSLFLFFLSPLPPPLPSFGVRWRGCSL